MSDYWDNLELNLAEIFELFNELIPHYNAVYTGEWSQVSGGLSESLEQINKLSGKLQTESKHAIDNLKGLENHE